MLNKKNILYFIQFVAGCLLTFLGMYLIIFPNFQQENLPYNKIEYTLLLLYLPTFIFHIIGYVVLNACQEDSITKRKKNLGRSRIDLSHIEKVSTSIFHLFCLYFTICWLSHLLNN